MKFLVAVREPPLRVDFHGKSLDPFAENQASENTIIFTIF
jgi:hypothetical protein